MGHTISKSLFLLMATMGLVTGLSGTATAYTQTPIPSPGIGPEHIAQFRNFPSRPDLDDDDRDDIRDEIEDRRDDDDDWDDIRDEIEDRRDDDDDWDDIRDEIEDRRDDDDDWDD
ncbi:MAG: hypothetical protein AAGI45_20715, partial [Cyanobacteria bacterium P01_H01_bin.26]